MLEERTRVRVHLLRALETGRFEDLPSGLYARAVVRSYADAVGLQSDELLSELAPLLPGIEDPIDGLARVRGVRRQPPKTTSNAALIGPLPVPPALVPMAIATVTDSAILVAIDLILLLSSARMSGVTVERLLEFAFPFMLVLWTFIGGLYFFLLGGLGGATPGSSLAGISPMVADRKPIDITVAGKRAWEFALRESSVLVELLLASPTRFGPASRSVRLWLRILQGQRSR
jgi:helix-turn-helix protein